MKVIKRNWYVEHCKEYWEIGNKILCQSILMIEGELWLQDEKGDLIERIPVKNVYKIINGE